MFDGNGEFILPRRAKSEVGNPGSIFFSATDDFGVKE